MREKTLNPATPGVPLTTTNIATLTAIDLDLDASDSDLSSVSNISDVEPHVYKTHVSKAPYSPSNLLPRIGKQPKTMPDSKAIPSTLRYDSNPPDRLVWLHSLPKPLPSSSLTAAQNAAVQQHFYFDEIARLENLRVGDEWVFEHFGETREVERVNRNGAEKVYARGVWRRIKGGEVKRQMLDEWPVDGEGKALG
jgi:hypothetical protein